MPRIHWLESLRQDIRYAVRQLRNSPGFTAAAVLSLTLGIGANTAIFQLVNAVRLRSLPVAKPEELALIDFPPRLACDPAGFRPAAPASLPRSGNRFRPASRPSARLSPGAPPASIWRPAGKPGTPKGCTSAPNFSAASAFRPSRDARSHRRTTSPAAPIPALWSATHSGSASWAATLMRYPDKSASMAGRSRSSA